MSRRHFDQLRNAISRLQPELIRETMRLRPRLLVAASSSAAYAAIEDFLAPATLSHDKRTAAAHAWTRLGDADSGTRHHLALYEAGSVPPAGWRPGEDAFAFEPRNPGPAIARIAAKHADLALALARLFAPFERAVARRAIHRTARDNALFSLMASLPDILPSFAQMPWAVDEFPSETAVLTANQIGMAFTLAAACDRAVGFRAQRSEIGALVAGAFGWRTLARELTDEFPLGGGLLPKAAIAYTGTFIAGVSMERIYRVGYGLTRREREELFDETLTRGRAVAAELLERFRSR
jgi:hypothetical protein